MNSYWLRLKLLSDTTFGRGDGVAGLVDAEVQHDDFGLPFLGGKTLKGLLMAECAEILNSAQHCCAPAIYSRLTDSARRLFGDPGSKYEQGNLHVGNAELPADLRQAVIADFKAIEESHTEAERPVALNQCRIEYLESLTSLRRQTSMDASGAPRPESLRSMRVIVRDILFEARLDFITSPEQDDLALLAACVNAFRRAGTGRHRGRGRLKADLFTADGKNRLTSSLLDVFEKAVLA